MSNELKKLETQIIFDLVQQGDEVDTDFVKESRKQLCALDEALMNNIAKRLISKNTVDHGLIVWINPAFLSAGREPEPIHLRDTLGYLFANCTYTSDGGDVYDVCAESCNAMQFDIIKQHWLSKNMIANNESSHKQLPIMDKLEWFQKKYFPEGLCATTNFICNKSLENGMVEIVSVAKKIFKDIASRRLFASDDFAGKLTSDLLYYSYLVLLYLTVFILYDVV